MKQATAAELTPRPAVSANLAAKLMSDFRVSISEKPLREALQAIAEAGNVNLWLDRHVDPTTPISTAASATTIYLALASAAESASLKVHVIENVVLVGRSTWVDRTAASVRSLPRLGKPTLITWPELSTPNEAWLACSMNDNPRSNVSMTLPHDLWPATRWDNMPSDMAGMLVLGQFNESTADDFQSTAVYPTGKYAAELQAAVLAEDANAAIKKSDTQLTITASSSAHRMAANVWLSTPSANHAKVVDVDKLRFTLRLQNAAADQVLRQLAVTSGRTLSIDNDAANACKRAISVTVQDESLRELAQRIAEEVKVQVSWTETHLNVSALR